MIQFMDAGSSRNGQSHATLAAAYRRRRAWRPRRPWPQWWCGLPRSASPTAPRPPADLDLDWISIGSRFGSCVTAPCVVASHTTLCAQGRAAAWSSVCQETAEQGHSAVLLCPSTAAPSSRGSAHRRAISSARAHAQQSRPPCWRRPAAAWRRRAGRWSGTAPPAARLCSRTARSGPAHTAPPPAGAPAP